MSEIELLRAELVRTKALVAYKTALLAFAKDVLLGYKSGAFPVTRDAGGTWRKEDDRAGLREMLEGSGGLEGKWGKTIWLNVRFSAASLRSHSS
jgi:hypothetical protein